MKTERVTLTTLKAALFAGVAAATLVALPLDPAMAAGQGQGQKAQGQGGGHGGAYAGGQHGQGGRSLSAIFRDLTGEDDGDDSDAPEWAGQPGGKSGMGGGKPGSAGSKKGDLFGDLWVILRDEDGAPILTPEGYVQPLDADGNLIPLDEEGHPVDESLTVEVEIGRLNVGRAPTKVLDRRADEVIALLNDAVALSLDPAGRLVITTLDENNEEVSKTIDSPLENLALYVALVTDGSIPGVSDLPGDEFDFMVDGTYTIDDLAASAAFLAAATDKTGEFTVDEIAYINAFLGVNTVTVEGVTYSDIEFETFSYDRSDTYDGVTASVLVQQPDGTWAVETVDIYDTVFGSADYTAADTLEAYTQSAEDARMVIEYIHEYAVPVDQLASN